MKRVKLTLPTALFTMLAIVAGTVSGADALAMSQKRQKEGPQLTATFRAEQVTQSPKGLVVSFSKGKESKRVVVTNGCSKVYYGGNLSVCVRLCGKDEVTAELSAQPDYDTVWSTVEGYRFGRTLPVSAPAAGKVTVNQFETPAGYRVVAQDSDSKLCTSDFNGNMCLAEMTGRLAGDHPLPAYRNELVQLAAPESGLDADLAAQVDELAELVGEVHAGLKKAGLTDYRRNGWFYGTNIRNAPALLCQLRSRVARVDGPAETMEAALHENRKELRRSLTFLNRLPSVSDDAPIVNGRISRTSR